MTAKKVPVKKAPGKSPAKKANKATAKAPVNRSLAVATTWADPKVAASRALRHRVKVGGTEYKSVNAAFVELGLPISSVIKFRRDLVLSPSGSLKHEGKTFSLVTA